MKKLSLIPVLAILALPPLYSQSKPFVGRWDFTVTTPRDTYPQWMEVVDKGGALEIRIQPRGGHVLPATGKIEGSHLVIAVSAAAGNRPAVQWDLTAAGDKLSGVQRSGENVSAQLAAVRAPELKRPMPAAWTSPEPLFNGKDLTGWSPLGDATKNHWVVRNGELLNEESGANIRTNRTFDDFKLHIEVNCPEHCNSGIYLRGRYEIQVGGDADAPPNRQMGAIYGFFAPIGNVVSKAGEWQAFDVTLVGRKLTMLQNKVTIHDGVELQGTTGGALDSNEGQPGPFYLQGDHTGGLRYRNITIATPMLK